MTFAVLCIGCEAESDSNKKQKPACSDVGDYGCFDDVAKLCRYDSETGDQYWESKTDCGASSTPDCHCFVVSGQGVCAVGNNQATALDNLCEGKSL